MVDARFYGGRFALVTGGTQGIGLSTARILSRAGCRVCLAARNQERLSAVCRELPNSLPLSLDVSDPDQVEGKLGETMRTHGTFDLVINCAGLAYPGYLEEQPLSQGREMMETNFFGTMYVCRTVIGAMRKNGGGSIANTSSIGGLLGLFGYTHYCASKFAVVGFTEALRREVRPFGIKVSLLCPPNTDTPGLEKENAIKPVEVLAQEEKVKTVSPDFVAQKLLEGMARGRKVIIPTADGWMAYLVQRYAPFVLDQILKRKGKE